MSQSDIARRADAIERELNTRTERLANIMRGEFDQDDAKSVPDKQFHEMIRRNWTDPNWRVATAQRMGPVALYKAALESFGRNADGSPSIDSHPDALAAEPAPTELQPPDQPKPQPTPLPSVFPFQGPAQPAPQPGMMAPPVVTPQIQQPMMPQPLTPPAMPQPLSPPQMPQQIGPQ